MSLEYLRVEIGFCFLPYKDEIGAGKVTATREQL
jgi:hypothetical protein